MLSRLDWTLQTKRYKVAEFFTVVLMPLATLMRFILYSSPMTGCNTVASLNAKEGRLPETSPHE